LATPTNISSFDVAAGLTTVGSAAEHELDARRRGISDGRSWLSHIIRPKHFRASPDFALRSLPRWIRHSHSLLLAHALLFFGVHDSISAASSSWNQSQNIPARSFARKLGGGL